MVFNHPIGVRLPVGPPKTNMKLLRIGKLNQEKPAFIDADGITRDLSSVIQDLYPETINQETIETINNINPKKLPEISSKTRIGACVSNPQKFIGIGLNYTDHAEETGMKIPSEPIVFLKANSCISGPYDMLLYLKNQKRLIGRLSLV